MSLLDLYEGAFLVSGMMLATVGVLIAGAMAGCLVFGLASLVPVRRNRPGVRLRMRQLWAKCRS